MSLTVYPESSGGIAIGGTVTSATAGSVFFAGALGVLAQNNAAFQWIDADTQLQLTAGAATKTPLEINLFAAQSADAFQVKDSSSAVVAAITKDGYIETTATGSLALANFKLRGSESGLNLAGTNSAFFMESGSPYIGFFNYGTTGITLKSSSQLMFTTGSAADTTDIGFARSAAGVVKITNGSTGAGAMQLQEMTAPSAPSANNVILFSQDNGAGKTQLMALFATGAAQQVAIEP